MEADGVSEETVEQLRAMSHDVRVAGRQGSVHADMIDPQSGDRLGARDRRDADAGARVLSVARYEPSPDRARARGRRSRFCHRCSMCAYRQGRATGNRTARSNCTSCDRFRAAHP
jgi:hypothetical protein